MQRGQKTKTGIGMRERDWEKDRRLVGQETERRERQMETRR
jgi:hypothetical protein